MGGVCTGGTIKHNSSPDFQQQADINTSGFSGKLKSIKSSLIKQNNTRKESHDVDVDDDVDSTKRRTHHIFDSGELHFSISREFKSSSTPAAKLSIMLP